MVQAKQTKLTGTGQVSRTNPADSVQIHLPDGTVLEGPRGTQLESFLAEVDDDEAPIMGAIVNGLLKELTFPIEMESRVAPITMADPDGMRIYRRSLTFLLATAFSKLFPEVRLIVDHSIASGGYFCHTFGHPALDQQEIDSLEKRMRELVEEDLPFAKLAVPLEEAIEYFRARGYQDKVRLLAHRKKANLVLYQLGEHRDYHHGYMAPRSGYLKWFALQKATDGFTLQFPRRHTPTDLLPPPQYPILLATFRRYGDWLQALGISNIGALNDAIVGSRARELILVAEALHERRIAEIAAQIAERKDQARIVLIAGPSSSGKTTFSKRLAVQLMALSLSPFPIGLDNFFVDREKTPRDESGDYDYESLYALDLGRLEHDLEALIRGEKVQLPYYDFVQGEQMPGQWAQLRKDQIIVLEGIHGLNPDLVPGISTDATFRIYASALTQLNLDSHNRVSTTDTRLIRRIVRDAAQRGYSASDTIARWESVRRGEKRYIFPYQENADVMFNSALVYEGAALAPLAEPLLRQVAYGTREHVEAKRLLAFLDWFVPVDADLIPDNSILREFLGGSNLSGFVPWQPSEPGLPQAED